MSLFQNCLQKLKPLNINICCYTVKKLIVILFFFFVQIKQRCFYSNLLSYFVNSIILSFNYSCLIFDIANRFVLTESPSTLPLGQCCLPVPTRQVLRCFLWHRRQVHTVWPQKRFPQTLADVEGQGRSGLWKGHW